MKDEIKEILEDVKRHLDYVEATKQSSIRDNEMKAMYDHITNLQKENKKISNQHLVTINKLIEVQDRIDKEIERLKKDLINLLRIIDKNCDDLEGTEEEFDSLDRTENLLKELKEGKK